MQSLGNDFILIKEENFQGFVPHVKIIQQLCHRHHGIGSDGLIVYSQPEPGVVRMKFFNPDGTKVKMCGNGLRCLFLLTKASTIFTDYASYSGEVFGNDVFTLMPKPISKGEYQLMASGMKCSGHFIDSGVEHFVIYEKDLSKEKLRPLAKEIRHHAQFAPSGVNVNFLDDRPMAQLLTYERGVEDFTKACGTGALACFFALGLKHAEMKFLDGGRIEFSYEGDKVKMKAKAYKVYEGSIELPFPFDS